MVGLRDDSRKVIADLDFKAVHKKMAKAKEIFFLLEHNDWGEVDLEHMGVMLKAGRIADSHAEEVVERLRQSGHEQLTFLDFLAHIPLFVDIHDDITTNPMKTNKRPEQKPAVSNRR